MSRQLCKPPNMAVASGFTIIELMITIVVAAILLTIAVPNFSDAMSKTDVAQTTNDLVGAFTLARSEAASRGRTVCVDAAAGGWVNGWDVKVDMNGDDKCTDAGDTVLRNYASPATVSPSSRPRPQRSRKSSSILLVHWSPQLPQLAADFRT